jgi:Haem-binding domain
LSNFLISAQIPKTSSFFTLYFINKIKINNKMKKKILLGLAALFIIIQFIPIDKNTSDDQLFAISKGYDVPAEVASILDVACNDCHTNKTEYPWYAKVQPVAGWLNHHVDEGKHHLNLSNFMNIKVAFQNHKLEEIVEQVEKKEMPLPSYTYLGLHSGANLTDAQRTTLITWAKAQMDTLKAHYPADSLKMPPRPQGPPPAH